MVINIYWNALALMIRLLSFSWNFVWNTLDIAQDTLVSLSFWTSVYPFLYARLQTVRIMVWWCPSGSPSGSPSVRPSVRLSVRPVSVRPFSALFSYMLWHIELKFCTWLCFDVLQIKFDCRHFASIFEGVMPLCELRIKVMCSFPHFLLHALTYWAQILHMTLFHRTTDQVRVPSICVNFCGSYAPFGT